MEESDRRKSSKWSSEHPVGPDHGSEEPAQERSIQFASLQSRSLLWKSPSPAAQGARVPSPSAPSGTHDNSPSGTMQHDPVAKA